MYQDASPPRMSYKHPSLVSSVLSDTSQWQRINVSGGDDATQCQYVKAVEVST